MIVEETKSTKQQILESTFHYLVEYGLENASIREICKYTGYSRGAITHYYESKNDMLCAAAKYALKRMAENVFAYLFNNITDIDEFFASCRRNMDNITKELRFIYQMASSPVYGDMMRESNGSFRGVYDEYAEKLSQVTGGDIKEIKPIIYIFIACIIDYAIWQGEDEAKIQLDYICGRLKKAISQNEKKE